MITRIFSRSALHEHEDPAQRVQGVAALPPDSGELARLLAADPAPEVRSAAAQRCSELPALAEALTTESDPAVRAAVATALGGVLSDTAGRRRPLPHSSSRTPARMPSAPTSRAARRMPTGAASRSRTSATKRCWSTSRWAPSSPKRARRRRDACTTPEGPAQDRRCREEQGSRRRAARPAAPRRHRRARGQGKGGRRAAGAAGGARRASRGRSSAPSSTSSGAGRRSISRDDEPRRARWEAARGLVQARFDRERDEQRARAQFERRLREWIDALQPPADADALRAEARRARGVARHRAEPRRRGGARDAGRGRSSGSPAGSRIATRSPAPRRSSSKPRSSRPARRSTTRICRSAGARSIARCAVPR